MLKKFAKNQSDDLTLNQVQDSLVNCLNPVFNNPAMDAVIVTGVSLASGANTISNPIQRTIQGVVVIKKSGFADFHTGAQANNQTPTKTIILTASAACTVDLYIF